MRFILYFHILHFIIKNQTFYKCLSILRKSECLFLAKSSISWIYNNFKTFLRGFLNFHRAHILKINFYPRNGKKVQKFSFLTEHFQICWPSKFSVDFILSLCTKYRSRFFTTINVTLRCPKEFKSNIDICFKEGNFKSAKHYSSVFKDWIHGFNKSINPIQDGCNGWILTVK